MVITFSNEIEIIGCSQTRRVMARKQHKAERALNWAFTYIEKRCDRPKLLSQVIMIHSLHIQLYNVLSKDLRWLLQPSRGK